MEESLTDSSLDDRAPISIRSAYIPPHLRNSNPSTTKKITDMNTHVLPPPRVRTRDKRLRKIESGRWKLDQEDKPNMEPNPFNPSEKVVDLSVSERESNSPGYIIEDIEDVENVSVKIIGEDVPPPFDTFAEINLGDEMIENIKKCKYTKPTPFQRHCIPICLSGRNLVACAQKFSGKTAAFCIPIISKIMKNTLKEHSQSLRTVCPHALILSPTRELACQIHEDARKFSYQTGVKVVVAYGGLPLDQQFHHLEFGADILVRTPGRLFDLIKKKRATLKMVKYLVLDEADQMLDVAFESQIQNILKHTDIPPPNLRQTMLFSSTLPDKIQRLASSFLFNYIFLDVQRDDLSMGLMLPNIEFVPELEKISRLIELVHAEGEKGMYKKERDNALRSFKTGAASVMISTDVAACGLEIPHVTRVINFDCPKEIGDFFHRIGHVSKNPPFVVTFFNEENKALAKELVGLMKEAKQRIPYWLRKFKGPNSRDRRGSKRSQDIPDYISPRRWEYVCTCGACHRT